MEGWEESLGVVTAVTSDGTNMAEKFSITASWKGRSNNK
jgi:hypothetical protein